MNDKIENYPDPENPPKETVPRTNRPIMYLPIIWKIQTARVREEIYNLLESQGLFSDEQKLYLKRTKKKLIYQFI